MNIENATILKFQNVLADSKADWEHIIYSNFLCLNAECNILVDMMGLRDILTKQNIKLKITTLHLKTRNNKTFLY